MYNKLLILRVAHHAMTHACRDVHVCKTVNSCLAETPHNNGHLLLSTGVEWKFQQKGFTEYNSLYYGNQILVWFNTVMARI